MDAAAAARLFMLARGSARSLLSYRGLAAAPGPVNVTFSVTNRCQSRCRTCLIWELYRKEPERAGQELTLEEIERLFRSMAPTYFFNVSGGEPFLRDDLPAIIELACRYLRPAVVHIPTNAIAVRRIVHGVEDILSLLHRVAPRTTLTLKPSFDGLGEAHDAIRGIRGNYRRVLELLEQLQPLRQAFPRFKVGLGTVVSTFNVERLEEIAAQVEALEVDSYINEIAEVRSEMFNGEQGITPAAEQYARAMEGFKQRTARMLAARRGLSRITLAFRLYYYDLVVRILREQRQVLPCYAGVSNVHISPYGDLWPCCVRGYEGSMGNVREYGHDFFRVWRSPRAAAIRRSIRAGECWCPLANQAYSNMLFSPEAVGFVLKRLAGREKA